MNMPLDQMLTKPFAKLNSRYLTASNTHNNLLLLLY